MQSIKHAHLIGIGGINMSAVAKLLRHAGVSVSGSDKVASLFTEELQKQGVIVFIGHAENNVPQGTDLVIYSSAVPEYNPERAEARKRDIKQLTNFAFLGQWTRDKRQVLITGTHGKSTTTALAGLMLERAGKDPTVVVGSRVPGFPDGNLRIGKGDLFVIEGDEYARHFLEFHPSVVLINNIELDHTDVFPNLEALTDAFRELLKNVRDHGTVIANADDPRVGTLIGEERSRLEARDISIKTFGFSSHANMRIVDHIARAGEQMFVLQNDHGLISRFHMQIPGRMNVMNAVGALSVAIVLGSALEPLHEVVSAFTGIWRRFEKIADKDGITVFSDYGHHPTAVRATLEAARSFYPGRRIVLCFQPHHRNRTKHLFLDFVSSFDAADCLLLSEIYDVPGRDAAEDEDVSSRDLLDAVTHHDADRTSTRTVEYASTGEEALAILKRWKRSGDVIIVMGAGDIFQIATQVLL